MKDGWIKEEGSWYYYKGDKKLNTTRINTNSRWYYLGKMKSLLRDGFKLQKITVGIMLLKKKQ